MIEVTNAVVSYERPSELMTALQRHADLVRANGERNIAASADLDDLRTRHGRFDVMRAERPVLLAGKAA